MIPPPIRAPLACSCFRHSLPPFQATQTPFRSFSAGYLAMSAGTFCVCAAGGTTKYFPTVAATLRLALQMPFGQTIFGRDFHYFPLRGGPATTL